ncbi:hypothetical protein AMS68_000643 [Peltaster fructicola]|uniref:Uncharacterized protein n=1 Tax=Peltaster fructicola TaxID=286661 RepID=A0A6H0XK94_9PEZI|nr:hypothetical protein AMS68_000643 [Peltaster fructicola]
MASRNRKSFLTYEPVAFSLTEGTNIPPPKASPPSTANGQPIQLRTPAQLNGSSDAHQPTSDDATRADSLNSPQSPSITSKSPRPQGVRRLFSLNSLRSSFSSSRASLSIPREEQDDHNIDHAKRPLSPSASVTTTASTPVRPPSRSTKKSSSWFSRKSGHWGNGALASIGENGQPDSKRLRDQSPAPLLPEINTLKGGNLNNGEVEWDEKLFKK